MEETYRALLEEVHASRRLRTEVMNMTEQAGKKRSPLRPVLAAALAVIALTGTVLAVGTAAGFDFVQIFNGEKTETWGDKEVDVLFEVADKDTVYFPVAELPQEVRDAAPQGDELVQVSKESWSEAAEWLGLDLPNSTVLEQSAVLVGIWVPNEDGTEERHPCEVILNGADLGGILVEAFYLVGNQVNVKVTANIKTDGILPEYRGNPWYGMAALEGQTADQEEYLTANGLETVIVTTSNEESIYSTQAFFTLNGVGYRVMALNGTQEQRISILKEVLDGF